MKAYFDLYLLETQWRVMINLYMLFVGGKSAKSTLKQSRRKSARRSVSFCSPVPERDSSSLKHPLTPHRSLGKHTTESLL